MRVLVTGGTSLIARATIERLISRGDAVTTMQRRPGHPPAGVVEVLGDIADEVALSRAVAGQEAVIHVAAKVDVVGSWREFERVNVVGTGRVLTAARAAGVTRFVHVSSPSVAHGGGSFVGAGADAADPRITRGHYATTKAMAERAALAAVGPDFAVVAVRPHLVWGPGDTQLVGRIVDRARSGRLAVVGSGGALVDTTYLDNAAGALVAALDRAPALTGRAFVISNGEPRPIRELLERIVVAAGLELPRVKVPRAVAFLAGLVAEKAWTASGRTDEPPITSFLAEQLSTAHWFDQRMTREALGWSPTVGIDEGLRRLAEWYATGGGRRVPCSDGSCHRPGPHSVERGPGRRGSNGAGFHREPL